MRKQWKYSRMLLKESMERPFFSDYIFAEVVTVMLLKTGFVRAEKFGKYLLSSEIEFSRVDEKAFERTWEIFRTTKNMSFTDCSNLALMELLKIKKIATFDKEFSGKAEVIG